MKSFEQIPKRIKYLEIISAFLLFCLPISIIIGNSCYKYEFYVFYVNIMPIIWIIPLLLAVIIKSFSILLQKRNNLSIKQSLKNFLKFLIIVGFFSLILSIVLVSPCSYPKRTRDIRIGTSMNQAKIIMESIYKQDNNYDNFNCKTGNMQVVCKEIDMLVDENAKPLFAIRKEGIGYANGMEPTIMHDTSSDSQTTCIYSPLNSRKNYWFCADSTGKIGRTKIDPGGATYCVKGFAVCPPLEE